MPATWSLTVTNGGANTIALTSLNAEPIQTAGPPPRITYTLNNGDVHTYYIKEGDDVCIKQT